MELQLTWGVIKLFIKASQSGKSWDKSTKDLLIEYFNNSRNKTTELKMNQPGAGVCPSANFCDAPYKPSVCQDQGFIWQIY